MRLTKEQKDMMVEAYMAGKTLKEAAALVGCCLVSCWAELKKRGIETRGRGAIRNFEIDDKFFDVIDTEAKAYWLGFISADGNVHDNTLRIALKIEDKTHLKKFVDLITPGHHIVDYCHKDNEDQKYCRVTIASKGLATGLLKLGVTERKSFTIKPCEFVPDEFKAAYWRGLVDGDGCITYNKHPRHKMWCVKLCGSKWICDGFRNWVAEFVESGASVLPAKRVFRISYDSTRLTKKIVSRLYTNATVYLDRKYEKAMSILREES